MKYLVALISACLLSSDGASGDEPAFRPLFNGKDLTGWKRINTDERTWSVADGMLICSGKPIGELRTERMYQNFVMEVEWRHMVPRGNAGIFVWADDITARGVPFHRGIEVQVLENDYGNNNSHTTHGDIFPIHGATMTPINGRGGSRAFPTEFRSNPAPEWNHYRIVCQDGAISLAVNGKVVTQGQDCSPRKGYICIESEGGVVHYRNMRIQELPETPVEPEHIAIADRGYHCVYTGIDLAGWQLSDTAQARWHANDWVLRCDGPANPGDDIRLARDLDVAANGMLIDVKFDAENQPIAISLRGLTLNLDPAQPELADALEPPGRWNRFEIDIREERPQLTVNGRAVPVSATGTLTTRGQISLAPTGPADFSNIYIRHPE